MERRGRKCTLCGRNEYENGKKMLMIPVSKGCVCMTCARELDARVGFMDFGDEEIISENFDVDALENEIKKYVIGQDEAVRSLADQFMFHIEAIQTGEKMPRNNPLLIGETGVGKTLLVENFAKQIGVPCIVEKTQSFTQAGYVGRDIEEIIVRLVNKANGNVQKAKRGIVILDEIDKISYRKSDPQKGVNDEAVQDALLKMIDGSIEIVKMAHHEPPIEFDTSGVLFIGSGAFTGIKEIIKSRLGVNQKVIGLGREISGRRNFDEDSILKEITPRDLMDFGFKDEFIGRFPLIVAMNKMTSEILVRIMTNAEDSVLSEYKNFFYSKGMELEFSSNALLAIAEKAIQFGTGARSLRNVLAAFMGPISREASRKEGKFNGCLITQEVVENGESPKWFEIEGKRRQKYAARQ